MEQKRTRMITTDIYDYGYTFTDWVKDMLENDPSLLEDHLNDVYLDDIHDYIEADVENFLSDLESIIDSGHNIVMSGMSADWMGASGAGFIFTDKEKLESLIYPGYDCTTEVHFDDGDLYIRRFSHDDPVGDTMYHLRIMTDAGMKEWDRLAEEDEAYDNDRKTVERFFNSDELTRPFTDDLC